MSQSKDQVDDEADDQDAEASKAAPEDFVIEHDSVTEYSPTLEDDLSMEDDLSLDDLGAAYARVVAEENPDVAAETDIGSDEDSSGEPLSQDGSASEGANEAVADAETLVTPETIVEAALFVGHPENKSLSEQRLASLMRGVSPDEIIELIERLNEGYQAEDQALRIIRDESGFRMTIAPAVEHMRRSFLGKVREARLSQMAIEVLSLVAYQPGITATKVQDQRGRESGPLLNQLVRRQLLRMERIKPEGAKRPVPHYYPTERFLHLFSLESLDELPQVEEGLRE
ncbi:MAG: SMC-Scp complex subunit ScpB [Rubripirellula sp.]|nr:SMC-Scp complex subunit ScpB [Rubripirellula sp.]